MHWQFHFLNINSTVVSPKALSLVHYSSHYSHILLFPKPSPLRRWHTAVSFLPSSHFSSSTDHLHNALDRISSWMTASLLTMNSSKTEFLFSGLSKQLAKINNSSLTTTHSVRNLGFIFDEHSPFLTRSHPSPNLAITSSSASLYPSIPRYQNSFHHRHFHCSLQPWLLQLYHNLPKSQITQLQHIQNSLARAVVKAPKNPVTSLPSFSLCTG